MAKPDGPSLSELKLRIAELKNSIKALGTVNVNAIEEYKELMELLDLYENCSMRIW